MEFEQNPDVRQVSIGDSETGTMSVGARVYMVPSSQADISLVLQRLTKANRSETNIHTV